MSFRLRHIARNVVWNWIATAISMLVAFFLSPFIVHRLGNTAYGIWILILSTINYLNLADLGMRSSVLRFVSKGYAQNDHEAATRMLSAALWIRLWISAGILLVSIVLSIGFPHFFNIPVEMQRASQLAVLIVGCTTAMSMSIGVVGGVISALNRYDIQSWITITQAIVRVIGIVVLLKRGHGILAIAGWEFVAGMVGNVLLVYAAHKIYPQLQVRLHKPERESVSRLWSYSFYVFLVNVAMQLVYYTDNVVVGAVVSAAAVTFYAIAGTLCRYTEQLVGSMTSTFVPVASMLDAQGRTVGLRKLLIHGTQITLALVLPISITLFVRGKTFISLWMGPEYGRISGSILQVLIFPVIWGMANSVAGGISFGTEKHQPVGIWAICEGIANLGLSIVLAHFYGPMGVAFGTLIPSFVIHVIVWPRYIHVLTGVRKSELLTQIWGPIVVASIPYAVITYAVDRYYSSRNLLLFFIQSAALLPIFAAPVLYALRDNVWPLIRGRFHTSRASA